MNLVDPRLVIAIIVDLFGWVSLVIDKTALAAVLFVVGAILALYSLLDWLTASDKPSA
jgi:uncharacterized membrane protein YtjA (UPF0391 family)